MARPINFWWEDPKLIEAVTTLEMIEAQGQSLDSDTLALRDRCWEVVLGVARTTLTSEAGKAAFPGWGERVPRKADLPHEQVSPSKMSECPHASGEA